MTTLDWSRCAAVESAPDRVGGAWVFKGTRLPVATVIENLEDLSVDEVVEQFDVTRELPTPVPERLGCVPRVAVQTASARERLVAA